MIIRKERKKERVNKFMRMVQLMKEDGKMIKDMDMVHFHIRMEIYIKAIGKTTKKIA